MENNQEHNELDPTLIANELRSNYNTITKYDYDDYVEMKEDLGWVNKDVADIVGFEHMSVKNQTQPKYDLPLWAQLLVHLWKQEHEGKLGTEIVKEDVINNLHSYRKNIKDYESKINDLEKKVDALETELRKAERKEVQRLKLIGELNKIERDLPVKTNSKATPSELKNNLGKLATRHRRKIKILDKLDATIDEVPDTNGKSVAKGKTKGKAKGTRNKVSNSKTKASPKKNKSKAKAKA